MAGPPWREEELVFNVCSQCGAWEVERTIQPQEGNWATALCSTCGHREPFLRLPLFMVTGPSGAGKTATCARLLHTLPECVVLESDILWGTIPADADGTYQTYRNLWLRMVKNIHQAGRPVLLCGSCNPADIEALPERRYVGAIHYLALVCDDDLLADRLRARPAWRDSGTDAFVQQSIAFNRWFKQPENQTNPHVSLLDTGMHSEQESAAAVAAWVRARL